MKKITIIIIVFFGIITNAQNSEIIITKLSGNGSLTGEVITSINNKTNSEIYNNTIEWISYKYRNTESVIQSKIDDKMIRFSGISSSVIGPYMSYWFDLSYVIQVDIKEGRIRFSVYDLKQVSQRSPYTKTPLEVMFKKGQIKKGKKYLKVKDQVDLHLSVLLISLKQFIEGGAEINDDW